MQNNKLSKLAPLKPFARMGTVLYITAATTEIVKQPSTVWRKDATSISKIKTYDKEFWWVVTLR
jgi:hypothetical protein